MALVEALAEIPSHLPAGKTPANRSSCSSAQSRTTRTHQHTAIVPAYTHIYAHTSTVALACTFARGRAGPGRAGPGRAGPGRVEPTLDRSICTPTYILVCTMYKYYVHSTYVHAFTAKEQQPRWACAHARRRTRMPARTRTTQHVHPPIHPSTQSSIHPSIDRCSTAMHEEKRGLSSSILRCLPSVSLLSLALLIARFCFAWEVLRT